MSTIDFLGFDPHGTEAADSFEGREEPIPDGEYGAVAGRVRKVNTKSGEGWFWEATFIVLEGEYRGRAVIHRFNMKNGSEQAVDIGRRQMRKFLDAIGNLEPADEDAMCDIPTLITVKCKESVYVKDGEIRMSINNEITRIAPVGIVTKSPEPRTSAKPFRVDDLESYRLTGRQAVRCPTCGGRAVLPCSTSRIRALHEGWKVVER